MGKRQRSRDRANRVISPELRLEHDLGQPGPFMVCRECNAPLSLYERIGSEDSARAGARRYLHALA